MQIEILEAPAHTAPSSMKYGLIKQTAAMELRVTKHAAGLTLERLTSEAYPTHEQAAKGTTARQTKHLKLLQNQLYADRY